MASREVSRQVTLAWVAFILAAFLASLLAPAGRWWGIDPGATDQALYVLGIVVLVWRAGWNPDAVFPADSSVAERRGWVAVFFGALVLATFIHFLWHVGQLVVVPESPRGFMSRQLG